MGSTRLNRASRAAVLCLLLAGCTVASEPNSVQSVGGPTSPPTTIEATDDLPAEDDGLVSSASWLDGLDVQVVDSVESDASEAGAWLILVDDPQAAELVGAIAAEGRRRELTDPDGFLDELEAMASADEVPADSHAMLLSAMVSYGFDANADFNVRVLPGEIGSEPQDQIEYVVGSFDLLGPAEWEQVVIDSLPTVGDTQSFIFVEFYE